MSIEIANRLPINPKASSVRLFFGKAGSLSNVWHIVDAALGRGLPDGKIEYMALHGDYIVPVERVDTIAAIRILVAVGSVNLCERCVQEFQLALPIIKQKGLIAFT